VQTTTAQSLGAIIKSARDIMRKDKGLIGDLDRLNDISEIWHPAGVPLALSRYPGVSRARPPATVWQPSGLAGRHNNLI